MLSLLSHNLSELDRQKCKDVTILEARAYDILQLKYDGIWSCVSQDMDKDFVEIHSRNGLLKQTIQVNKFPPQTVFAAEFMFGSQWAQHPDRVGKLFVYDCLMDRGTDLRGQPYQTRYEAAQRLLPIDKRFHLVKTLPVDRVVELLKELEQTRSHEGLVFRRWNDPYLADCGRIKIDIEDDYVVMKINPGKGKHEGKMGSLTVGQYKGDELVPVMEVGGGFSDDERIKFPHVGSVILVRGKARFTSGALRHPNFIRVRPDKSRFECIFVEPTQ